MGTRPIPKFAVVSLPDIGEPPVGSRRILRLTFYKEKATLGGLFPGTW